MSRLAAVVLIALILLPAGAARAVMPDEMLQDPALEHRAREISKGLRCLVCQNQSIDDSDADLAKDLRLLVRERLKAGDSDAEVVNYLVARYGDFVLLKPPVKGTTIALWAGPALFVLLGAIGIAVFFRRNRQRAATAAAKPAPLSPEEQKRLAALLDAGDTKDENA